MQAPELEFRAAEALFEQAPAFLSHVRDAVAFLEEIGPRARCALEPEIRKLPAEASTAMMRTAAVDSVHRTLSTAGICAVFCAAFRTSATNSKDHGFGLRPVDPGFDVEPVARLMRCTWRPSSSARRAMEDSDHDPRQLVPVAAGRRLAGPRVLKQNGDPGSLTTRRSWVA